MVRYLLLVFEYNPSHTNLFVYLLLLSFLYFTLPTGSLWFTSLLVRLPSPILLCIPPIIFLSPYVIYATDYTTPYTTIMLSTISHYIIPYPTLVPSVGKPPILPLVGLEPTLVTDLESVESTIPPQG
jgi:hypothetical protein